MVGIQRLIKHDDGTVQEVSITKEGWIKESYYKPQAGKAKQPPDAESSPYGSGVLPQRDIFYKQASWPQLIFYLTFWGSYLALLITLAVPLSPYRIQRSFQLIMGPNSYPIHCNRAPPTEYVRRCFTTFFCNSNIDMPVIKSPNMTFYPNFTSEYGTPADYSTALFWATSYLNNPACTNFTVMFSDNTTNSQNDTINSLVARDHMLEGIFILKHNCHPEAVSLSKSRCGAYRWKFVDLYDTSQLDNSTCNFNWTQLNISAVNIVKGPECVPREQPDADVYAGLFLTLDEVSISE
ncbi:ORF27 [Ovine gammaherpesvirus 2]|uniref:ORF27 n=1 Tax=Ovine gammaherpesvirus 2 TaxID=10398 RepID=Q2VSL3_9GAMA|nr:ORF27 [Ovine gammaherpesvirus 2]AAX58063.1 ORF27 [Ovine gammaherpesvirus 2]